MSARACAAVAALCLLAAVACEQGTSSPAKQEKKGSGWLVTPLKKERWNFAPVGDGEHLWAWRPNGQGVFIVDRTGGFVGPSLSGLFIDYVRHGFAVARPTRETSALSALYRVGTDVVGDVAPISPKGFRPMAIVPARNGVWVEGFSEVGFAPRDGGGLQGPWPMEARIHAVTDNFFVSASEDAPSSGKPGMVTVTVHEPSHGPVSLGIPVPDIQGFLSASTEAVSAGDFLWLAPQRYVGVLGVDLRKAADALRKGQTYEPLRFLLTESWNIRSPSPGVVWACSDMNFARPSEMRLFVINASSSQPQPVEVFGKRVIAGFLPLDANLCLVQTDRDLLCVTSEANRRESWITM